MATEIIMPKLSDTMTEGHLGAWRKSIGEKIERGEIVAEVETDKATMELESFASGVLLEQLVQAGELVPVGTVIGLIGLPDDLRAADSAITKAAPETQPATPIEPESSVADLPLVANKQVRFPTVQAAPIVRHRAAELGMNLVNVIGSGPGGRILLEDLELQKNTRPMTDQPGSDQIVEAVAISAPVSANPNIVAEPLGRMRAAISRVTTESWQTIPHFYISIEVEMGRAEKVVRDLKTGKILVSLNTLILAAVAAALVKFPALNATLTDQGILKYTAVNLAFAVAIEGGLLVPVIKGAEKLGVQELHDESSRLAAKARAGDIAEVDISGGSFCVSNLGMHKVDSFTSIIMPAQSGILAVGSVADRPVVLNGSLEIGRLMTATLSCDHRIIDGVYAAEFLNEFKNLLENPTQLPA